MPVGTFASAVHIAAGGGTDVLLEPFNNFTAWTQFGSPAIVAARTSNGCELVGGTDRVRYSVAGGSQSDTFTIGFAYRISSIAANRHPITLFGDAAGTAHVTLRVTTTGAVAAMRGSVVGTVIGTSGSTGLIAANTWAYIEVQTKLHDTTGFVIVNVNEVEVLNLNPVDTKAVGTLTVFDTIDFIAPGSGVTALIDDFYLTSGAGAAFKGDITV